MTLFDNISLLLTHGFRAMLFSYLHAPHLFLFRTSFVRAALMITSARQEAQQSVSIN